MVQVGLVDLGVLCAIDQSLLHGSEWTDLQIFVYDEVIDLLHCFRRGGMLQSDGTSSTFEWRHTTFHSLHKIISWLYGN